MINKQGLMILRTRYNHRFEYLRSIVEDAEGDDYDDIAGELVMLKEAITGLTQAIEYMTEMEHSR